MVTVGFVVEGASEKRLIESELFRKWLREDCNLEVVDPVVDAVGNGNMCSRKIETFVKNLRTIANPDKVVVLADLDPDTCAPCVQKRKEIIGYQGIDLVAIAKRRWNPGFSPIRRRCASGWGMTPFTKRIQKRWLKCPGIG